MKDTKSLKRIADAVEANGRAVRRHESSFEPRTARAIAKERRPLGYRVRVALYTSPAKSAARCADRMSFPIMGMVGPNGGGKTAAAVEMAVMAMEAGRRVLSTVPLMDWRTGEPHPLYVPWTHWDQLLDWWDGDVLADEILSIAGSRGSASLDPRAQTLLVQLRKRNARFWWTAPSYRRADLIIREVTQAITECRGYYESKTGAQHRRGVIQSWAPKRLFAFRTYDAVEFDDWTEGKREKVAPLVTEWFHGPGSHVFGSYDTLGAVNVIATVNDAGICENCNGTVSNKPKPCRCAHPRIAAPVLPIKDAREIRGVNVEETQRDHAALLEELGVSAT